MMNRASDDHESADQRDADLIDGVRRAARSGIAPADIEAYVGQPAWINTVREPDSHAIKIVDIGPDDESGTEVPRLSEARDVVYWGRPVESRNPRVVGIAWNNEGEPHLFFGILFPP